MEEVAHPSHSLAMTLKPFVCSMFSACLASAIVHPVDLTKTRLQVAEGLKPSTLSIVQRTYAEGGVRYFYTGLTAALLRQAIYGTNRLALHRVFSDKMKESNNGADIQLYQKVGASFASGGIASIIGNPCDVALIRMQADAMRPLNERRGYKNVVDALTRIIREEGVPQLWRGSTPTVIRAISMNVGMMASYDEAKQFYTARLGPGTGTTLLASATAGFTCAWLSLPFDLVKTRLQNMKPIAGELPYTGVIDCATKLYRADGLLSFWRGFGAYYGRSAPHAMIVLMTLEVVSDRYNSFFKN